MTIVFFHILISSNYRQFDIIKSLWFCLLGSGSSQYFSQYPSKHSDVISPPPCPHVKAASVKADASLCICHCNWEWFLKLTLTITFDLFMELEIRLTRDDLGTRMEEKLWFHSFNEREASLSRCFVCEVKGNLTRLLNSWSSQLSRGHWSPLGKQILKENGKHAVTKIICDFVSIFNIMYKEWKGVKGVKGVDSSFLPKSLGKPRR